MLDAKGVRTVSALLYYAPFRYEDRRNVKSISLLAPGEKAAVLAQVSEAKASRFGRQLLGILDVKLHDGSGAALTARWFRGERYRGTLTPGVRVALFGKVELERGGRGTRLMVQPEVEILTGDEEDE